MNLFLVTVVVAAGVASVLQAQFMGQLDDRVGTLESMFITYASGGLTVALIMALARGGNLLAWRSVPSYALSTGLLGLVVVGSLGYSATKLGLLATFTVFLVVQLVAGTIIDQFGWFGSTVRPVDMVRLAGVGVLGLGTWLVLH